MDQVLERLHKAKSALKSNLDGHASHADIWPLFPGSSHPITLLTVIIQLDSMLLNWHDTLPGYLMFTMDDVDIKGDQPAWLQRQVNVLKIRFLSMRTLLHRQTVLYLLQPPDQRQTWPQSGSVQWPPLFADYGGGMSIGGATRFPPIGTASSSEANLAHLSASMCVKSALLTIDSIDIYSPLQLTEAWWWDFNGKLGLLDTSTSGLQAQQSSTPFLCSAVLWVSSQ